MKMMDAVKSVFTQYATFSGRARRSEYWYFTLFTMIVSAILGVIGEALPMLAFLDTIYSIATLVPGLAVTWRRLHDIGKGGGWYFLLFIPLVGWIFLLVWLCRDSQPGENAYGPNPKEVIIWDL